MIKSAVEKELIKYGINVNANNVRDDVVQSSSRTNNPLIDNNEQSDVNSSRATHFIVNDGNIDYNRSREHNYPDPAALAKQTKPGLDTVNCHMATEMGLPRNGNKDDKTTGNRNTWTPRRRLHGIPYRKLPVRILLMTFWTLQWSPMNDQTEKKSLQSRRLADAITSRLPAPNSLRQVIKPVAQPVHWRLMERMKIWSCLKTGLTRW